VYIDGVRRATSLDNGAGVTTTVAAGAHRLRVTLAGTSTAVAPSRTLAVRAGSLTTAYVVSNPDGSSPAILRAAVQLGSGYHLVAADGGVFAFGGAGFFGSAANVPLAAPIATAASTGSQRGYWLAARDGGVFAFGDAPFVGSAASLALAAPIVAMAGTPTNRGYWLVTSDGGVFAFGDARFAGSLGTATPPAPIVAIAPTRACQGYLLLAENGDVFAFGDARYRGGAKQVDTTAVALSAPASGTDYWVAFANGGRTELAATRAFLFPPLPPVNSPITSMVATSRSDGAWLASADGGVFALGTAGFYGTAIGFGVRAPIVAVV
jgi:hypothetical protein